MFRQASGADLTGMRRVPPFTLVLFVGAICSAAGLLVSQWPAGTVEAEGLAPAISAFPTQSTPATYVVPTVVTEVTPPTTTPVTEEEPTAAQAETPPEIAIATEIAEVVATPTPTAQAMEQAPVSTVVAHAAAIHPSVVDNIPEKAHGLVEAMNAARLRDGQSELVLDSTLTDVALSRARDLVERGYFGHYGPDGGSAFSELAARGVNYALAGENLARNNYAESKTVAAAFEGLMASPGHRANILESRFTRVGVVAVQDGRVWVYVTVFMS